MPFRLAVFVNLLGLVLVSHVLGASIRTGVATDGKKRAEIRSDSASSLTEDQVPEAAAGGFCNPQNICGDPDCSTAQECAAGCFGNPACATQCGGTP